MKIKKQIAGILAMTCAMMLSIPTVAKDSPSGMDEDYQSEMSQNVKADYSGGRIVSHRINGIEIPLTNENARALRFKYLHSISARMVQEKGKSTITGSALTYDTNHTTTLTITAQRSKDGKTWKDLKSWSDVADDEFIVLEEIYYLAKGYQYRSVTKVNIDSGADVEVVTVASSTVYY